MLFLRSFVGVSLISIHLCEVKIIKNPLDWNQVYASVNHEFKMEDPHFDDTGFDPARVIREEGEHEAAAIQNQEESFIKSMLSLRDIEDRQAKGEPVSVHTKFVPRLRKLDLD